MNLRNRLLAMAGRLNQLQAASESFWRNTDHTYLASDEYYEKRMVVLSEVLGRLPQVRHAIDVGCGDGRFTFVVANRADSITGYDISPALVEKATVAARTRGEIRARFETMHVNDIDAMQRADLVSCMGVLSCILDETNYARAVDKVCRMVNPGGFLLLVDTVATGRPFTRAYGNGYVARYRSKERYEAAIGAAGLRAVESREISKMSSRTVNNIYLFKRDNL